MLKQNTDQRAGSERGATNATSPRRGRFVARVLGKNLGRLTAFFALLTLTGGLWPGWQSVHSAANSASPALKGQAALEHLKAQGQYDSLQQAMQAARYGVRQTAQAGEYAAANNAQGLHARFTPAGVELAAGGSDQPLGLTLRGVGYGKRLQAVSAGTLQAAGQRIGLRRTLQPQQA